MKGNPRDPKQGLARLFGDAATAEESAVSPFGDTAAGGGPQSRLRSAVTRLRILRSQAGADGLTPSATRSLLDEVVSALEAIEDALSSSETNEPGEEARLDP